MKNNPLSGLFESARHAQGDKPIFNDYGDVRGVIRGKPAVRGMIDLQGDELPNLENTDGTGLKHPPKGTPAVENSKIDAAIIKQSLVAQAGAQVIIYKDASEAVSTGMVGDVVMVSKPAYFETFEAAPFALVPDGQDVGVTPLPIKRAAIHIDATGTSGAHGSYDITATNTGIYGLRFEFDRATLKGFPNFEDAIMHAIVQGLARTADAVLLSAIAAGTPQAPINGTAQPNIPLTSFSLAAAAAASVRMSELRALVGTSGNGAAIDNSGVLRAAGIAAELTPDMAGTIVGSFARSAIMIRSNVDVIAERTKIDGSLAVTAWAAFQPLLPDTSRFWTVGA